MKHGELTSHTPSMFKYTSLCTKSNLNGVRKCEPGSLVQRKGETAIEVP